MSVVFQTPKFLPPPGTRDVLPEEAAELARIVETIRATLVREGFGEHRTPLVERDALFIAAGAPPLDHAYRFLGDAGELLVLRPDLTIPTARSVAARLASDDAYRVFYSGTVFAVNRDGHPAERLMAGADVYGPDVIECAQASILSLCRVLDEIGLRHAKIGLGDATGIPRMLVAAGVPRPLHERILVEVRNHNFVALNEVVASLQLDPRIAKLLTTAPQIRGDASTVLSSLDGLLGVAARRLDELLQHLDPGVVRDRVLLDLGDVQGRPIDRDGLTLNVYVDGIGSAVGAGGDFSSSVSGLGIAQHAFGYTLDVQRLHEAVALRA
jgi:ATP phosphoribosyltransferase regulatory subunit